MSYFDPKRTTKIYVDASPSGLGMILTQCNQEEENFIIAYASRSLSDTESDYSQIERETLAVFME